MRALALLMMGVTGCSFAVAATGGAASVERKHAWVDAGLTTVTGFGCAMAAVAWGSPDSYAPTQGDATSWRTAGDRLSVQETGALWAPVACVVAAVVLASTVYGQVTAPEDPALDAAIAGGLAAVAGGFSAAQQATTTARPEPEVDETAFCTSDYGCGAGFACVKRRYATEGKCEEAVDEVGAQTFKGPDPASVGPNMGDEFDCERDGCPAGFSCDIRSGVCEK